MKRKTVCPACGITVYVERDTEAIVCSSCGCGCPRCGGTGLRRIDGAQGHTMTRCKHEDVTPKWITEQTTKGEGQ